MSELAGAKERTLSVVFHTPDAGWIDVDVLPLTDGWQVSATHLTPHFDPFLRWLEAILDGAETARWSVDGETVVTQFVYLGAARSFCHVEGLLAMQAGGRAEPCFAFFQVGRVDVVRAFYEAYRLYAETVYDPSHWETDEDLETTWGGEPVRLLTSPAIETALRMDEIGKGLWTPR